MNLTLLPADGAHFILGWHQTERGHDGTAGGASAQRPYARSLSPGQLESRPHANGVRGLPALVPLFVHSHYLKLTQRGLCDYFLQIGGAGAGYQVMPEFRPVIRFSTLGARSQYLSTSRRKRYRRRARAEP